VFIRCYVYSLTALSGVCDVSSTERWGEHHPRGVEVVVSHCGTSTSTLSPCCLSPLHCRPVMDNWL